jgi:hypothetical protein
MRGAVLPLPQCVFMAWCLVKHRDNFTLIFSCGADVTENSRVQLAIRPDEAPTYLEWKPSHGLPSAVGF